MSVRKRAWSQQMTETVGRNIPAHPGATHRTEVLFKAFDHTDDYTFDLDHLAEVAHRVHEEEDAW